MGDWKVLNDLSWKNNSQLASVIRDWISDVKQSVNSISLWTWKCVEFHFCLFFFLNIGLTQVDTYL